MKYKGRNRQVKILASEFDVALINCLADVLEISASDVIRGAVKQAFLNEDRATVARFERYIEANPPKFVEREDKNIFQAELDRLKSEKGASELTSTLPPIPEVKGLSFD